MLPSHCSQDVPDPDLAALLPPFCVPIPVPTVPLPPTPAPRLPADSHHTAALPQALGLCPFIATLWPPWSFPHFCLYSPSSRLPLCPTCLSLLIPLSSTPCLPSLLLLWGPSPWLPPQSIAKAWLGGWYPSSANGPLPSLQGPGHTLYSHWLLSAFCLCTSSLGVGGVHLAQVRRTSWCPPELRPGSGPHCLGPILGRGSETWFSRHTPGTLPRYSSLTHRLMPCLYPLLGEVWIHGALAVRTLGGAAWVAQPCLSRTPWDWDSESGRRGREKLR